MQPKQVVNDKALLKITLKELGQFFSAPIAWLFLAAFLLITLFIFFWVESFFSRNIADVRPLFEWMPLLLIFLSAALTMKMWSEERKSGTLEYVLTQPVPLWQFVVGKFLACWALLAIALVLTLPLPITVANLGDLDWGPVWSGYLAALLLGGAYLSMGLFVSARCDNQIVSLILTVVLAVIFYLLGAGMLTNFVGNQLAEVMRQLGTGSRFESITRGVIDVRDLYYYASLILAFLALNIFSLERGRWAKDGNRQYHFQWRATTLLLVINAIFANVWLSQINQARVDTTEGGMYSISDATRGYLAQLQEPLLIRGYFSEKTHPLLAPLVPQMQDLLREYEVAGEGRVNVEIIDPTTNPELEQDANRRFNIHPTPFNVNDRHQSAVVNSYFDILIQYGSEHVVLSFGDLIDVRAKNDQDINVYLRNPEYDITRTIKKVLYAYQTGGNIFDAIDSPLTLTAYVSGDALLPEELVPLKAAFKAEAEALKAKAGNKLTVNIVEPEANDGLEAKRITEDYGFGPMSAGLFDPKQFFFYVVIGQNDQLMQVDLGDFSEPAMQSGLKAAVKRFAKGFTRTVAMVRPEPMIDPKMAQQLGMPPENVPSFQRLYQYMSQDLNILDEDLSDGQVDPSADILVLTAPAVRSDKARFAIDQFLMRGGTVVMATAPNAAKLQPGSITMEAYPYGLEEWLDHYGISFSSKLVLDRKNTAFPIPTVREMGGRHFQEMRMMSYPYFPSIRGEGLNQDTLITSDLPEVTVPWASSILVDEDVNQAREVTVLMRSSAETWYGSLGDVLPNAEQVQYGYTSSEYVGEKPLAIAVEGEFESFFQGKTSPLLEEAANSSENDAAADDAKVAQPIHAVVPKSPETARLIVIASNDIFRDEVVGILGTVQGGNYFNSLQLAVNAVEWALEDKGLLSIRSRSNFNRTLEPMESSQQQFWEYLNYGLALFGLLVLWGIFQYRHRVRMARYKKLLAA